MLTDPQSPNDDSMEWENEPCELTPTTQRIDNSPIKFLPPPPAPASETMDLNDGCDDLFSHQLQPGEDSFDNFLLFNYNSS